MTEKIEETLGCLYSAARCPNPSCPEHDFGMLPKEKVEIPSPGEPQHRIYTQKGESLQTIEQVRDFLRMKRATVYQKAEAFSELCELLGVEWR